ncbi:MAG TPA: bifunctional methylenetetrahydrofolate dehydrogenase/methenyltetrahydrofolate cyclohydrolase FolD [Blastocatellia bacterium]|nr:bifunctional methylenetetrahydrofolate dehydrogenase/methenyltetrahydrofolate cyclohydrolase FolD [Blastocatellia bacterium]
MAILLDGKRIADEIRAEVKLEVDVLLAHGRRPPGLAVIIVGGDPASHVYVGSKVKACLELGYHSARHDLPETATTAELLDLIDALNNDPAIDGILVQLPLPRQIDSTRILNAISPHKDIDGFHPLNVGQLYLGHEHEALSPCTPAGIIELLQRYDIDVTGKRAVVIGRSAIVGKPMVSLLINRSATVTVCHSRTRDLPGVCREADILVAAIGKPGFVTDQFVKPGAVVIDVGINQVSDPAIVRDMYGEDEKRLASIERRGQTLAGDVNPRLVEPVAGWLTPVPGGVGPLTIAMLMKNTLKAYGLREQHTAVGEPA